MFYTTLGIGEGLIGCLVWVGVRQAEGENRCCSSLSEMDLRMGTPVTGVILVYPWVIVRKASDGLSMLGDFGAW